METTSDSARMRETLGHFPTGVALITAIDSDGSPVGMVVGSFTSVSLDPPLVAFLPTVTSGRYARIATSSTFCVNVLAAEQESLCRRLASSAGQTFDGVGWTPAPSGSPVVDGSVSWIDCSVDSVQQLGDHFLVVGEVRNLGVAHPEPPLVFFQGGYGRFANASLVAAPDGELIEAVRTAEVARPHLDAISERLGMGCEVISQVGNDIVYVAAAGSAPTNVGSALGMRVPLIAPVGEQVMAWADAGERTKWLDRGSVIAPEARDAYLARLDLARERGWSISLVSPDKEIGFYDALRSFTHVDPTPAREREFKTTIAAMSDSYGPVDLVEGGSYDIRSIVVPVLGDEGVPRLYLRLVNLPSASSAASIRTWIAQLQATAQAVSTELAA